MDRETAPGHAKHNIGGSTVISGSQRHALGGIEVDGDDADEVADRVAALAEEATSARPEPLGRIPIVAESCVAGTSWDGVYQ